MSNVEKGHNCLRDQKSGRNDDCDPIAIRAVWAAQKLRRCDPVVPLMSFAFRYLQTKHSALSSRSQLNTSFHTDNEMSDSNRECSQFRQVMK
jgi:hypothetical protein